MTTRDVIAAIDGAIEDWDTSDDAMRWTPEPPEQLSSGGRRNHLHWAPVSEAYSSHIRQSWADMIASRREATRLVQRSMRVTQNDFALDFALVGQPDVKPDVRQRALDARRNRNTGPGKPIQNRRRPR
ncbi:hypothetical protein LWF01_02875 [Saxibacter everestensis]|uniref:DUF2742 domain-containing protein n=1 Tax=Saxibacter everestensis TaxID=2909229 RepID=A0ABY8QUV8_9MICO|nr:hypothetical protein LWF01_02875 [Brevibacteriaceae bacterium ZFBP1038]